MLELVPVTLAEAISFVEQKHRHHGKTAGHKFSVAVGDTETGGNRGRCDCRKAGFTLS